MFIQRDYNRTEHDDFVLNVEDRLKHNSEPMGAVNVYDDDGNVVGWKIKPIYE